MLRANSLPAVTTLVVAVRPSPAWRAYARTVDLTRSRSDSPSIVTVVTASRSAGGFSTVAVMTASDAAVGPHATQPGHALFSVECGGHIRHGHAQLDERDRYRRTDADDGCLGSEHADHPHQAGEDTRRERVDHVEGADVDQGSARVCAGDLAGEVPFDRFDSPVVELTVQGDQEIWPHVHDGGCVRHGRRPYPPARPGPRPAAARAEEHPSGWCGCAGYPTRYPGARWTGQCRAAHR